MSSRVQDLLKGVVLRESDDTYLAQVGELESKSYLAAIENLRGGAKKRSNARAAGLGLPFAGNSILRFTPGRWSLWSGTSHGGKTQFLRFLMTHGIKEGEKVLFASLEEEPDEVALEFCAVALATRSFNDERIDTAIDFLEEKLYVFNHSGFIEPDVIVGAAIYAAKNLGVTHVVIDSLMMLSIRKDDFEAQKDLGMLLRRTTRQLGIHIHMVAHPRKGGSSQDMMDMYDIQGAQELVALADSVITLQRAPKNPKKRDEWGITADCDALLRVWKQRGEWNMTGHLELGYLPGPRQWAIKREHGPRRFMPDQIYPELGIDLMGKENPYDDPHYAAQYAFV